MTQLRIHTPSGIPEVTAGTNLVAVVGNALESDPNGLADGDVLVVTSKIVSKAEGRSVPEQDHDRAVESETVRVVAERTLPGNRITRIVENRLGIVGAAAGVDASNTAPGTVLLLPQDPDESAYRLRIGLQERFSLALGVIISDTVGRPWRVGQTDIVIGASGIRVLVDLAGTTDATGRPLNVTAPAVGDEIAAAADLVKGKSSRNPVAVVRGMGHLLDSSAPGARVLQYPLHRDWFRRGSEEAFREGYLAGLAENRVTEDRRDSEPTTRVRDSGTSCD